MIQTGLTMLLHIAKDPMLQLNHYTMDVTTVTHLTF